MVSRLSAVALDFKALNLIPDRHTPTQLFNYKLSPTAYFEALSYFEMHQAKEWCMDDSFFFFFKSTEQMHASDFWGFSSNIHILELVFWW